MFHPTGPLSLFYKIMENIRNIQVLPENPVKALQQSFQEGTRGLNFETLILWENMLSIDHFDTALESEMEPDICSPLS